MIGSNEIDFDEKKYIKDSGNIEGEK